MSIQQWSDQIIVVELDPEPQLSEDLTAAADRVVAGPPCDVVLNLGEITHLNSSNISQMLRLRQRLIERGRRLRLCAVNDNVWGVMITTGLDKVFNFAPDMVSALASLQLKE